jgi:hypothetical protein
MFICRVCSNDHSNLFTSRFMTHMHKIFARLLTPNFRPRSDTRSMCVANVWRHTVCTNRTDAEKYDVSSDR